MLREYGPNDVQEMIANAKRIRDKFYRQPVTVKPLPAKPKPRPFAGKPSNYLAPVIDPPTQFIPPCPIPPKPMIPINSVDAIMRAASKYYDIPMIVLKSVRRNRAVVRARHVAAYLAYMHTGLSFPCIGRRMGGRDHTTILHSVESIKLKLRADPGLASDVEAVRLLAVEIDPRLGVVE